MAISRISSQDIAGTNNSNTISLTYPGATTSGNLLIAVVSTGNGNLFGTDKNSITGWQTAIFGGCWSLFGAKVGDQTLFYKVADGTETTITANTTNNQGNISMILAEFSGTANPVVLDGTPAAKTQNPTGTTDVTPNITTAKSDSLILAVCTTYINATSNWAWTNSTLFNHIYNSAGGSNVTTVIGQFLPGVAETNFSDTITWTTSAGDGTMIAAFQAQGLTTSTSSTSTSSTSTSTSSTSSSISTSSTSSSTSISSTSSSTSRSTSTSSTSSSISTSSTSSSISTSSTSSSISHSTSSTSSSTSISTSSTSSSISTSSTSSSTSISTSSTSSSISTSSTSSSTSISTSSTSSSLSTSSTSQSTSISTSSTSSSISTSSTSSSTSISTSSTSSSTSTSFSTSSTSSSTSFSTSSTSSSTSVSTSSTSSSTSTSSTSFSTSSTSQSTSTSTTIIDLTQPSGTIDPQVQTKTVLDDTPSILVDDPNYLVDDSKAYTGSQTTPYPAMRFNTDSNAPKGNIRIMR